MESRAAEKRRRWARFASTKRHVRRQLEIRRIAGIRNDIYGVGVDESPTLWRNTFGWFKKNRWQRHKCGKRRRGRPSIGYGACHIGGARDALKERRRLRQELRRDVEIEGGR